MKKYILFLLTILVVLGTTLITNMMIVNNTINKTFNDSGYVLRNTNDSERYYFNQESTYKKSYNDQIVFDDIEGEKVVIHKNNFIHYDDGSISSFTKGVLLDLENIDTEPITYYNISANKILKKLSNNKYVTKNLDKELQFTNLMWRISENKYLVAGNALTIIFSDGTEKQINGYLELEYTDNEIIKIFNQEVTYETISSDVYLKIGDNVKINLGTKIVSKNDVNEMTLENMVIDSNDNVTIIDMEEYKEEEEKEEENTTDDTTTGNGATGGNVSGIQGGNAGSVSGGDSVANGGNVSVGGTTDGNKDNNNKDDDNNIIVDEKEDVSIYAPKFTIKEFNVTATRVTCKVEITDTESRLTQDTVINILDNSTGKIIYENSIPLGKYVIEGNDIDVSTLNPNKEYTLVIKSAYKVEDTEYSKNFIYKIFRTPILGLTLSKDVFTDESLAFNIDFESDSNVKSLDIILEDPQGIEPPQSRTSIQNESGRQKKVEFVGLTPDKEYIIKIANLSLVNAPKQEYKTYEYIYKTLKNIHEFENGEELTELTIIKDERDGYFALSIPELNLDTSGIDSLRYEIFTVTEEKENIVYAKTVSANELKILVNNEPLKRNVDYHARVYATLYDNEKTVEYVIAQTTNSFIMDTKQFPTISFDNETAFVTWESINGVIIIDDKDGAMADSGIIKVKCSCSYEDAGEATFTYTNGNPGEIRVDFENLRKDTTYKLTLYMPLDLSMLEDNEDEDKKIVENCYIDTVFVNTRKDADINADWYTETPEGENTRSVYMQLRSTKEPEDKLVDIAARTLREITINLYEGEGTEGKKPTADYTFTDSLLENYETSFPNGLTEEYESSLKEKLYDNKFVVVGENNIFLEGFTQNKVKLDNTKSYTIQIDKLYDYTTNLNEEDGSKGNKIEVIKTDTFVFTSGEAIPENPNDSEDTLKVIEIRKEDLASNQNKYIAMAGVTDEEIKSILGNTKINNDTVVAYQIYSTENVSMWSNKTVSYYIYENENDAYNTSLTQAIGEADLTITAKIDTNQEEMPSALMLLDNTKTENGTELRRGKRYYFTYVIEDDGNPIWPIMSSNKDYNWWSEHRKIYREVSKQAANIVMYPLNSSESTCTYKYTLSDIDNSMKLYEINNIMTARFICRITNTSDNSYVENILENIVDCDEYTEAIFDFRGKDIPNDAILEIITSEKYTDSRPAETVQLIRQEKYNFVSELKREEFSYSISQLAEFEQSKQQITLNVSAENRLVNDISQIKINFKTENEEGFYIIKNANDRQSVKISDSHWNIILPYYEIIDAAYDKNISIKNKTLIVTLDIYYANGGTGYEIPNMNINGVALQNDKGKWLSFNGSNFDTVTNAVKHIMEVESKFPKYKINGKLVEFEPSSGYGLTLAGQRSIIPKEIAVLSITDASQTIEIKNVVPTVSGVKMNPIQEKAYLEMGELKNKNTLNNLYIELYNKNKEYLTTESLKQNSVTETRIIFDYINSQLTMGETYYYKIFASDLTEEQLTKDNKIIHDSNTCFYVYDKDEDEQGFLYDFIANASDLNMTDPMETYELKSYKDKKLIVQCAPSFMEDISTYTYRCNIYLGNLMANDISNSDVPKYSQIITANEIKDGKIIHEVGISPDDNYFSDIENLNFKYNQDYTIEVIAYASGEENKSPIGYSKKLINIPAIVTEEFYRAVSRYQNEGEKGLKFIFNLSDKYKCFMTGEGNRLFNFEIKYGNNKTNISKDVILDSVINNIITASENSMGWFDIPINSSTIPNINEDDRDNIFNTNYFIGYFTISVDTDNDGEKDEEKTFETVLSPAINEGFGTVIYEFTQNKTKIKFSFKGGIPSMISKAHTVQFTLYGGSNNTNLCSMITEDIGSFSVDNSTGEWYYTVNQDILNENNELVNFDDVTTVLVNFLDEKGNNILFSAIEAYPRK